MQTRHFVFLKRIEVEILLFAFFTSTHNFYDHVPHPLLIF